MPLKLESEQREPAETPPADYEFVKSFLLGTTGALEEASDGWVLQMNNYEATLVATGLARYAERQPDSWVAAVIDESDLGAVVVGMGSYTIRGAIRDGKRIQQLIRKRNEAALARAKAEVRGEAAEVQGT